MNRSTIVFPNVWKFIVLLLSLFVLLFTIDLSPCCLEGEGGGEGAEVVAGGHCFAVGSGAAEGYEGAAGEGREMFVLAEYVGGFADGAYHVVDFFGGIGSGDVFYLVVGAVEGGTQKVAHAGVDYRELFFNAMLYIEHT